MTHPLFVVTDGKISQAFTPSEVDWERFREKLFPNTIPIERQSLSLSRLVADSSFLSDSSATRIEGEAEHYLVYKVVSGSLTVDFEQSLRQAAALIGAPCASSDKLNASEESKFIDWASRAKSKPVPIKVHLRSSAR